MEVLRSIAANPVQFIRFNGLVPGDGILHYCVFKNAGAGRLAWRGWPNEIQGIAGGRLAVRHLARDRQWILIRESVGGAADGRYKRR